MTVFYTFGSLMWLVGIGTLLVMLVRKPRPAVLPTDAPVRATARMPAPGYRSRHHEDTVEVRPATYVPTIGRRRIAAMCDDTQLNPVVTPR